MSSTALFLALCLGWAEFAHAHVVITYPGWRGNNLIRNETFPSGMQWTYPCGGLPVTTNRTHWPIDGGAVAFQPGWFTGHETALIYINLGLGEQPDNHSLPLTKFHIKGPTNNPYPGSVCLPTVEVPANVRAQIESGDLATIQVVEAAKHGAGLYSCADIIFTDDRTKVPTVDENNCFNSSDIDVSNIAVLGDSTLNTTTAGSGSSPILTDGTWSWSCEENARSSVLPSWCSSASETSPTSSPSAEGNGAGEFKAPLTRALAVAFAVILTVVVLP